MQIDWIHLTFRAPRWCRPLNRLIKSNDFNLLIGFLLGLKEVDYSSDDADDLMKNLANNDVARRSPAAGKASQVTPIIKPSKNDRALKRQNKKKRKNRKNRKTKRNGGGDASVVKGRRWTRRSEESDPFKGGSSQLLGLGKPTIRPNQLTPFVSVGSLQTPPKKIINEICNW